jgi:hypothetical protein
MAQTYPSMADLFVVDVWRGMNKFCPGSLIITERISPNVLLSLDTKSD